MNFVKLVFEEHICRINHKETPMTLSATIKILSETTRNVVSTSDDVIRGSYRVIFFAQPRFKPIGEAENFHLCNKYRYITIHKEFISYRNLKFVSQYIAIFLSCNLTVYFSFNSCLVAIASPEDACLSHVCPYKRCSYSHVSIYIILILLPRLRKVQN